ncbi:hypothetical protein [Bergeriella denitrificans]|uniref:Uncharacterized protein n=1 Tax=Bergeriella denitrificans TaxID=494 RepID=A0A378UKM8_BERDE|nr:hypothetical protein [Bergeriella denitrificans]STZ77051.1 Uncharacterised protein [Bergeriella denitrificans]
MSLSFNISIISPPSYPHVRAFDELAELLRHSLLELGYPADITANHFDHSRTNILFGIHLWPSKHLDRLPASSIIMNTEQLEALAHADEVRQIMYRNTLAAARRFPVWDYDRRNIRALAAEGIPAVLWEIGHHPALERIRPAETADIDVLFYGSINPRRANILNALSAEGLRVKHLFGLYGAERDAWIARAKMVLNLHAYDTHIFEIVRCSYLMSNGICTVSEVNDDTSIAPQYRNGIVAAPYGKLVETCMALAHNAPLLEHYRRAAFDTISRLPQAAFTRNALAQTPNQAFTAARPSENSTAGG